MCGLTGAIAHSAGGLPQSAVARATASIVHRGPDGEGAYLSRDGRVFLGHRRLAIIDISEGSAQPFRTERSVLAYNGEIYNYRSLRAELEAGGVAFRSAGDTEVVARGYEQWGTGVFDRLQGMFAIAIHDLASGKIVLARDRFGIKPLYVSTRPELVSFASEVKALVGTDLKLAPDVMLDFFGWGHPMAHASVFADVHQVPPGGILELSHAPAGVIATQVRGPVERLIAKDRTAGVEDVRRVLDASVQDHMIADVPVAVALSGGLDSSVVAAMAGRLSPHLTAFTASFEEPSDVEVDYAERVSRHCGLDHRLVHVDVTDLEAAMRSVAYHVEEPIPHPNHLMTLALGAAVRDDGFKVILVGEGSDELFAGYPWHRLGLASSGMDATEAFAALYARRGLGEPPYLHRETLDKLEERRRSWQEAFARVVYRGGKPTLTAMLHYDQLFQLQFSQLQRVDRTTMASGVEARVPYLYDQVLDVADRLPDPLRISTSRWRFGGRKEKVALARAARNLLPAEVLSRPKFGKKGTVDVWSTPAFKDFDRVFDKVVTSSEYSGPRQVLAEYVDWTRVGQSKMGRKAKYLLTLLLMTVRNASEGFAHCPSIHDGIDVTIRRPAASARSRATPRRAGALS